MKKEITAYCFANGVIKFGSKVPSGALIIERGPEKQLREAICAVARLSYPSKRGGKDSKPLVPGIPEAVTQAEGVDALTRFIVQIRIRINPAMHAVEAARRADIQYPDPIVIALFKNDLHGTVAIAKEYFLSIDQIDQAVRHIKSHIPTNEIQRLLRKWGAR